MPDIFHAIRLKENGNLRKLASHIDEQLAEITKDDMVSYAVYYNSNTKNPTNIPIAAIHE